MTEWLGMFWLRPAWLIAVPLALVAGVVLMRRARQLGAWEQAIDPHLLVALRRMGRVQPGARLGNWLATGLIALIALALSGPAQERRDMPSFRNLDAVVLAVDLSASTTAEQTLMSYQTAIRLIAAEADTRQIALIVFAAEPYLAAAFTTDASALGGMVSLLDGETVPVAGSRPGAALQLARDVLSDAEILAADVVLFSDGGGLGPDAIAATRQLAARNARLSVIAVPGRDADAASRLALDQLATLGGGAIGSVADPFPVATLIADTPATRLGQTEFATLFLADRGRWLLVLALIPALLLMPRRART